jgi:hypothetical protein
MSYNLDFEHSSFISTEYSSYVSTNFLMHCTRSFFVIYRITWVVTGNYPIGTLVSSDITLDVSRHRRQDLFPAVFKDAILVMRDPIMSLNGRELAIETASEPQQQRLQK